MPGVDRVPSGVNRRLWLEALEMADGDRARIEVRSATSLIVHNTAEWEPAPAEAPKAASARARSAKAADPQAATAARSAGSTSSASSGTNSSGTHSSDSGGPDPTVTAIPPTPEWKSAAPPRVRQHTRGRPKSDVPAFLAPAPGGLR